MELLSVLLLAALCASAFATLGSSMAGNIEDDVESSAQAPDLVTMGDDVSVGAGHRSSSLDEFEAVPTVTGQAMGLHLPWRAARRATAMVELVEDFDDIVPSVSHRLKPLVVPAALDGTAVWGRVHGEIPGPLNVMRQLQVAVGSTLDEATSNPTTLALLQKVDRIEGRVVPGGGPARISFLRPDGFRSVTMDFPIDMLRSMEFEAGSNGARARLAEGLSLALRRVSVEPRAPWWMRFQDRARWVLASAGAGAAGIAVVEGFSKQAVAGAAIGLLWGVEYFFKRAKAPSVRVSTYVDSVGLSPAVLKSIRQGSDAAGIVPDVSVTVNAEAVRLKRAGRHRATKIDVEISGSELARTVASAIAN